MTLQKLYNLYIIDNRSNNYNLVVIQVNPCKKIDLETAFQCGVSKVRNNDIENRITDEIKNKKGSNHLKPLLF